MDKEEKKTDKYMLNYFLFYAMGVLTLVPQNYFITATSYWMYKFRDTDDPNFDPTSKNRTVLQAQFTSNYSIVSLVSLITFIVLTIHLAKRISTHSRIVWALFSMIFLFMITIIFVEVNTDSWQTGFYVFSLFIGFLLNATSAVCIITIFQLAGRFPVQYMGALLSGQAICGIFSSIVLIISVSSDVTVKSAYIYFGVGSSFVLLTLLAFLYMERNSEFYMYYERTVVVQTENEAVEENKKERFKQVLFKIKYLCLVMILIMGSTQIVVPGVVNLVQSSGTGTKWSKFYFIPVVTFFLYNLFDYLGRELAVRFKKPKNVLFMIIVTVARLAFIPLLMLCNAQPRHHMPVVFNSDVLYAVFSIIFAFTHGYILNLSIVTIPSMVTAEDKKYATIAVILCIFVSMMVFSFLSSAAVQIL